MIFPKELRARILDEARAAAPLECCGLLEGTQARIVDIHPARNLAREPDRFEIDPALQFRLRREGRRVVGCYHSHPGGAPVPSSRDIEGASEIGLVWIIAAGDALGAYVWDGSGFEALALE